MSAQTSKCNQSSCCSQQATCTASLSLNCTTVSKAQQWHYASIKSLKINSFLKQNTYILTVFPKLEEGLDEIKCRNWRNIKEGATVGGSQELHWQKWMHAALEWINTNCTAESLSTKKEQVLRSPAENNTIRCAVPSRKLYAERPSIINSQLVILMWIKWEKVTQDLKN